MAQKNIQVTASDHPQLKDITLISVKGFIDTTTAPEFDRVFQGALGEKKFKLIIDLKDVNYISSAGWGIFVGEIKRIRSQKGDLFLSGMTAEVVEAYELLQFNTIIKAFPTVDQAIQKGFGKTVTNKAPVAVPKGKVSEPLQAETTIAAAPSGNGQEPSFVEEPKKPSLLLRILMPWKKH